MRTFPHTRMRRSRAHDWSRRLVAQHRLTVDDLIWPCFVAEAAQAGPVASLPGVSRLTIDELVMYARRAWQLGIPAIALFPVVDSALKDEQGSEALNSDNLICRAIRAIKDAVPDIGLIGDVALDPYTSHGQDGLLQGRSILNDATVEALTAQALTLAQAGCDVIAPSDMMDGRIGAIRTALEADGYHHTLILSYAAKYASGFYGPFRDAVGSAAALGSADKRSYQMDPANADEALEEMALDIAEGADWLMVKPALPYLDIVSRAASRFAVPIMAYHVSGEYAALKLAASQGIVNEEAALLESLLSCKRAGASAIVTYAAMEIAEWLQAV